MSSNLWHLTSEVRLSPHERQGGQVYLGGRASTSRLYNKKKNYPIATLPTKVSPFTGLMPFCPPIYIYTANFLSITNCLYVTFTALSLRYLMEPSGSPQSPAFFVVCSPLLRKKRGTNEQTTQWKKFCFSQWCPPFVPREYRFHFRLNNPSLLLFIRYPYSLSIAHF